MSSQKITTPIRPIPRRLLFATFSLSIPARPATAICPGLKLDRAREIEDRRAVLHVFDNQEERHGGIIK
jgi:hypothetical protein